MAVNLNAGTASLTGAVVGVQNVIGSANGLRQPDGAMQGNVLVGHGSGNHLVAGSGRSVLIGGFGENQLTGGNGDDILIGGRTVYDANPAALARLLAQWQQGVPYPFRINELRDGTDNYLALDITVFVLILTPGGTLKGNGGLNWFFTASRTNITDLKSDEQVDALSPRQGSFRQ